MTRPTAAALPLLLALAACVAAEGNDAVTLRQPTVRALATAWSGGQETPRCQDQGPNGEYLGGVGQQRYCEWRPPAGVTVRGKVSALVDRDSAYTLITWERPTDDVAEGQAAFNERRAPRYTG